MIVYSHSITPRLQYVVDFLSQYFHMPIKLTSSEEKYLDAFDVCKLNYSYHQIDIDEIWIHPHALLSETAVRPVKVECFDFAGRKAFFKTEGDFPFDIFAAIFFLLSRYEEYLPHPKDMYGRFAHTASVAFKEDFLQLPLINFWLEEFRKAAAEKSNDFAEDKNTFSFVPTYDIDMAWCYRNKGFNRNAGALLQSVATAKFGSVARRVRVLNNKMQDPWDCYEWLDDLHQRYSLQPIYFFLVADRNGKYDRNISVQNKEFQQLVHNVAKHSHTGLHPSWQSGDAHFMLRKEKGTLEFITGHNINKSRQHYIRFTLPQTYRRLIELGITNEYSMGYGSINGFRASIATPFYWYDLLNEEQTKLLVHPFCFMDANSYYEQGLSAEEAMTELQFFYQNIRSINGTMYTVWHNSFLGTDPQMDGWRDVYEQFVASVCQLEKATF